MKYISTRGGMTPLQFSDILLEGLAPDGGLAVPEQLPQVSAETLESWRGLPYATWRSKCCRCSPPTFRLMTCAA